MTGILEQLRAKTRRHVVVPVETKAPTEEQELRANEVRTRLVAAVIRRETAASGTVAWREASEDVDRLQAELEAVEAENQVQIAFTAMDSEDFEKIAAVYPSPEGRDAGMDWKAALPVVAAICADDPELQEDTVWKGLLEQWTHGEKLALWGALLRLNINTPEPYIPKG